MSSVLPLFVYGTLRAPEVLRAVLGHVPRHLAAAARGYRTVVYPGRTYPAIVDAKGETAGGLLLFDLSTADLTNLDIFEGNEYERRGMKVRVDGKLRSAEVYWPLARIAADARAWRYDDWYARHAQAMIAAEGPAALRDRLIAEVWLVSGDTYDAPGGPVTIVPVDHASLVIRFGNETVYVDPVGGAALYDGEPPPTAILITHEHGDHLDLPTLTALSGGRLVPMIVNRTVHEKLPDNLRAGATMLRNGESGELLGLRVEAIPAYNIPLERQKFHPPGVGNGYVFAPNGLRIYIPSDGEDTDEMKALKNIDIAFLPINQPYTMTPEQAATAIAAFRPRFAYPFHCEGTDPQALKSLVPKDSGTEVVIRDWYAKRPAA